MIKLEEPHQLERVMNPVDQCTPLAPWNLKLDPLESPGANNPVPKSPNATCFSIGSAFHLDMLTSSSVTHADDVEVTIATSIVPYLFI